MKKVLILLNLFLVIIFINLLLVSPVMAAKYYTFNAKNYFFPAVGYRYHPDWGFDWTKPPPGKTYDQLKTDYDTLVFLASVQGLVNRHRPNLYIYYNQSVVAGDPVGIDERWKNIFSDPSVNIWPWMNGGDTSLTDLNAVINQFKEGYGIKGRVIWTEEKPYTLNLATTIAGAENYVIVRKGSSFYQQGTPLYETIKAAFPEEIDLTINSQFTSKKTAYTWLVNNYLKTGKVNPILALFNDGYPLKRYSEGRMFDVGIMCDQCNEEPKKYKYNIPLIDNWEVLVRGIAISKKAFVFDLGPNAYIIPRDEPNQPQGADRETMQNIFTAARGIVGDGKLLEVWGWPLGEKYSYMEDCLIETSSVCLEGEWAYMVSKNGGVLRVGHADAYGFETTNLSFYHHGPGIDFIPQPAPLTPQDLLKKNYVLGYPKNFSFENDRIGSDWVINTTNKTIYHKDWTGASHGDNFLAVNNSTADIEAGKSFYQDIPIDLWRGYRYSFSIKFRSRASAGVRIEGTQAVWALGRRDPVCVNNFSSSDNNWKTLNCDFMVTEDGLRNVRIEIYPKTADKNYNFDEAYLLGPNTLSVINPTKKFIMYYMGDYDVASNAYVVPYLNHMGYSHDLRLPIWDNMNLSDPNFPLSFGVSTAFNKGISPLFAQLAAKKGPYSWFVMPDSGAGYLFPGSLRNNEVPAWVKESTNLQRQYNYSLGWIIELWDKNRLIPTLDETFGKKIHRMYRKIAPKGILYSAYDSQINFPSEIFEDDTLPNPNASSLAVLPLYDGGWGGLHDWQLIGKINDTLNNPFYTNQKFFAFRVVFVSPQHLRNAFYQLKTSRPEVEAVDPETFVKLFRISKDYPNISRASITDHTLPTFMVQGRQYSVSLTLRNDGWNIWMPQDGNNCDGTGAGRGCERFTYGLIEGEIDPAGLGASSSQIGGNYTASVALSKIVYPGEEITFSFKITAPGKTGKYSFQGDLVKEFHYFFETQGNVPWQKIIHVVEGNADFNNDKLVNFEDIESLVLRYNQSSSTMDLNSDGKVNSIDYVKALNIKDQVQ